jgi:hypothetical protein
VYGQASPAFSDSITGFVNGDTASEITGSAALTTNATVASGVGNYTIHAGKGTLKAQNYRFTFVNGVLNITPATLTVMADDAFKIYLQPNPVFRDSITGFVNGDSSSVVSGLARISTNATIVSRVGNYPIRISQGTLNAANYIFAFVNGTLTVSAKRPVLTIRANDVTKVLGQTNTALSYTITGFVNGDSASVLSGAPSLSTTLTPNSGIGVYPILTGPGTLSAANYDLVFINGSITVATPAKNPTTSSSPSDLAPILSSLSVSNSTWINATSPQPGMGPNSSATTMVIVSAGTSSEASSRDKAIPPIRFSVPTDLQIVANGSSPAIPKVPSVQAEPYVPPTSVKPSNTTPMPEVASAPPIQVEPIVAHGPQTVNAVGTSNEGSGDLAAADSIFAELDSSVEEMRSNAKDEAIANTLVVTGGVAVAGSVLLNTRAVYWFLSALLARPAFWRRFDPLDVIYAWEREQVSEANRRPNALNSDSLHSMVN